MDKTDFLQELNNIDYGIFSHQARDLTYLKSCWKRANRFGMTKELSTLDHPLGILWYNIKTLFLTDDYLEQMHIMDYFAMRVDKHLENNLLDNDELLHVILHEWQKLMPFDPTKVKEIK